MRRIILFLAIMFSFSVSHAQKKQSVVQKNNRIEKVINSNWTFNYFPKESVARNFEAAGFDDSKWSAVSLPHTWRTYETTGELHPFIVNSAEDDNMYWWTGWGWYRKHFAIAREHYGKKVFVEFDGVQKYCKVYLNGKLLGDHKGAYGSFDFDITPYVKPEGADNVMAVAVNNFQDGSSPFLPAAGTGGYYEYGGIIRNVRLVIKDQLHIPMQGSASHEGGTFVTTPKVSDKEAVIRIQTWVKNDYGQKKNCTLQTTVYDATDKIVQVVKTESSITPGQLFRFDQTFKPVRNPHLWSPENPYLYRIKSEVLDAGSLVDSYFTTLGIRSFSLIKSENSLIVNGKITALKGSNRHQDYPWLGGAVPEWLSLMDCRYRSDTEGHNFIRTVYNPDNKVVYEQADKCGMVVDAETYSLSEKNTSPQETEQKVKEMIRRNRNHPSVMFWSFGNESYFSTASKFAQAEDTTRRIFPGRINPDSYSAYFNFGDKQKTTATSAEGIPARIVITGSHSKISADRGSVVLITAGLADSKGNPVNGALINISWKVTGPAALTGPVNFEPVVSVQQQDNSGWFTKFPANNIIRSTGLPGKIKVTVYASGLASGSVEIESEEVRPDNSVIKETVLSDEGRKPVPRLIINLDRLDEVPKEIAYAQEPVNVSASDRPSILKSVRDYILKNNPSVDTASVEFRRLAGIITIHLQNNGGNMSAEDYNYNADHFNNCRLISGYINATKLPPLFKETLKKYYANSIITLGSEKNAGNEMNWLNWIPSGGVVVIVQDDNTKTGIKGVVYTKKTALDEIIGTVYPQFPGFSEEARERALIFISKMNPNIIADPAAPISGTEDGGSEKLAYTGIKGEIILIPMLKFISE